MTELGKDKAIDSLKRSYICPKCGREGAFVSFAHWRTEDLENGSCSGCDFIGTISEFRKSTREILTMARGRLLGAYCAIATGLSGVDSLLREIEAVFDPEGNAIEKRIPRMGRSLGTSTLNRLDALDDLIKARLQDLED